jgi:hypothetical protein
VVEALETTERIALSFISLKILRLREPQAADYVLGIVAYLGLLKNEYSNKRQGL